MTPTSIDGFSTKWNASWRLVDACFDRGWNECALVISGILADFWVEARKQYGWSVVTKIDDSTMDVIDKINDMSTCRDCGKKCQILKSDPCRCRGGGRPAQAWTNFTKLTEVRP